PAGDPGARAQRDRHPGAARRGRHDPVRVEGAGHPDGGPRRHDGLRLRARLHRVLARGLRAPHPRRAARRPAAVPAPARGRAVLADPRPRARLLGVARAARHLPAWHVGPGLGRRDARARRAGLEATVKIRLEDTTSSAIANRLVDLREEGGAVALGRVLTLVIVADGADVETAVDAANAASREHPCRVIVVAPGDGRRTAGLDAEIRVGADAGASDVIILEPRGPGRDEVDTLVTPLLLPDAPIVVWWPKHPPEVMSADLLGTMAQRRISDVGECSDPIGLLHRMAETYAPGDTDLSWARTTLWRGVVAAALDEPPYEPVKEVRVYGSTQRPSSYLFSGWLAYALRLPVTLEHVPSSTAVDGIDIVRRSG